jgi:hypothetical protein
MAMNRLVKLCNAFSVNVCFGALTQGTPLRVEPWAEGRNRFAVGHAPPG